jgi:hypothetical protein
VKPDYAKWMLDDPRVNFAISTRGRGRGLDHLGIKSRAKMNCIRCMAVCMLLAALSLKKDKPSAATQSPKSRGSMTPPVFHGKHSSRRVKVPITAKVVRKARGLLTQERVALRKLRLRSRNLHHLWIVMTRH